MTEQYPSHNTEQQAPPTAERLAQLQAALAEAQERRREAENLRSKLLLWRAIEQKVLTHPVDGGNMNGAKRLFQLPDGDRLQLLGSHATEKLRQEYPGEFPDDPNESYWNWGGNILRPGQYTASSDGEITPPDIDDVMKIGFTILDDADVSVLPEGASDTHLLNTPGVDDLRSLIESAKPLGPTVYRHED